MGCKTSYWLSYIDKWVVFSFYMLRKHAIAYQKPKSLRLKYSRKLSMPWVLMAWRLASTGHLHTRFWLCRPISCTHIDVFVFKWSVQKFSVAVSNKKNTEPNLLIFVMVNFCQNGYIFITDILILKKSTCLTHWGRGKMAFNFRTTFSSGFCWMKHMNFD